MGNFTEVHGYELNPGWEPPFGVAIDFISWACLLITGVGVVGNGLAFATARSIPKPSPTLVYIKYLAVFDTLSAIHDGVVTTFMKIRLGVDLRLISGLACRLHSVHTFWSSTVSTWLLVVMSGDRLLALVLPYWYRDTMSPHRASRLCNMLWAGLLLLTGPLIGGFSDIRSDGICSVTELLSPVQALTFYVFMFYVIHCGVPVTMLLVINLVLVCKLHERSKGKDDHTTAHASHGHGHGQGQHREAAKGLSGMLVGVSVMGVATNLCILLSVSYQIWLDASGTHFPLYSMLEPTRELAAVINSSVNFYIYISGGYFFRKAFLKMALK